MLTSNAVKRPQLRDAKTKSAPPKEALGVLLFSQMRPIELLPIAVAARLKNAAIQTRRALDSTRDLLNRSEQLRSRTADRGEAFRLALELRAKEAELARILVDNPDL